MKNNYWKETGKRALSSLMLIVSIIISALLIAMIPVALPIYYIFTGKSFEEYFDLVSKISGMWLYDIIMNW